MRDDDMMGPGSTTRRSRSRLGRARIARRGALVAMGAVLLIAAAPMAQPAQAQTPSDVGGQRPMTTTEVEPAAPPQPAATPWSGRVRFVDHVETKDPVFFITVDDGITVEDDVASWVSRTRTPVTIFLTQFVSWGKEPLLRRIAAYGSIQNHTRYHESLTSSSTDVGYQVCSIQHNYAKRFGDRPYMLRPPYGNGGWSSSGSWAHQRIADAVRDCGIEYVVNWLALVDADGSFVSQHSSSKVYPGDIVLLHFTPGLKDRLQALVRRAAASGLRPANLADYLPLR